MVCSETCILRRSWTLLRSQSWWTACPSLEPRLSWSRTEWVQSSRRDGYMYLFIGYLQQAEFQALGQALGTQRWRTDRPALGMPRVGREHERPPDDVCSLGQQGAGGGEELLERGAARAFIKKGIQAETLEWEAVCLGALWRTRHQCSQMARGPWACPHRKPESEAVLVCWAA